MHVKVLIVQTGSIDYVPTSYYERYKNEGLVLIEEEPETIEIAEAPKTVKTPKSKTTKA